MKQFHVLTTIILITVVLSLPIQANAEVNRTLKKADSDLYPDMLLLLLLPQIQEAVNSYYSKILKVAPVVYPYEIEIVKAERIDQNPNNRGYDFLLTLEVQPVIGPHIAVGQDRMTLEISPLITNIVKITSYQHVHTNQLPLNWQHLLLR